MAVSELEEQKEALKRLEVLVDQASISALSSAKDVEEIRSYVKELRNKIEKLSQKDGE